MPRLSLTELLFFVGIDWAAKVHAVCVLDRSGRKVAAFTIEHTAAGAGAWVRVIYRCWVNGEPYDPDRHNGARRHLSTAHTA